MSTAVLRHAPPHVRAPAPRKKTLSAPRGSALRQKTRHCPKPLTFSEMDIIIIKHTKSACLAQPVEHAAVNRSVGGSSPSTGAIERNRIAVSFLFLSFSSHPLTLFSPCTTPACRSVGENSLFRRALRSLRGSSPLTGAIVAARRTPPQLPGYRGAVCFYTLRLLFASQKCKTFAVLLVPAELSRRSLIFAPRGGFAVVSFLFLSFSSNPLTLLYPTKHTFCGGPDYTPPKILSVETPIYAPQNIRFAGTPVYAPPKILSVGTPV